MAGRFNHEDMVVCDRCGAYIPKILAEFHRCRGSDKTRRPANIPVERWLVIQSRADQGRSSVWADEINEALRKDWQSTMDDLTRAVRTDDVRRSPKPPTPPQPKKLSQTQQMIIVTVIGIVMVSLAILIGWAT